MKQAMLTAATLVALGASSIAFAQDAEEGTDFTLDGEFGLLVSTGNTDSASVKARLSASQELKGWSNDYLFEGIYKKSEVTNDGVEETQTTAQSYFLSAQGNYKLDNSENRLFVFGSHKDDRFSGFDFQSTIAAGRNSVWFDTPEQKFTYSIGPGYSMSETTTGEIEDSFIIRGAIDYHWKISETANFQQRVSTEIGEDNTKSRSESSLSAKLAEAMSLKVSLTLNHNSEVIEATKKLDTETSVTLVYTFF